MRIYRENDFNRDVFWDIFLPGYRDGETAEDARKRAEELLKQTGVQPIAETGEEVNCADTLEIGGAYYHVGLCNKDRCAVTEIGEIELDEPEEREDEDRLYCPYCGKEIPDSFELGNEEDFKCPICGSVFDIVKEVEVRWSSYPVRAAKIKGI